MYCLRRFIPADMHYTPGFFRSLVESCSNTDFYRRIKDIRLLRSLGFLLLLSLLVSALCSAFLYFYLNATEVRVPQIMGYYDHYVPDFQANLSKGTLQISPQQMEYYFDLD